jgi:hypothetical protein
MGSQDGTAEEFSVVDEDDEIVVHGPQQAAVGDGELVTVVHVVIPSRGRP